MGTDAPTAKKPDVVERAPVGGASVDAGALSRSSWDSMKPLNETRQREPHAGTLNFDDHPSIFPSENVSGPKSGKATDGLQPSPGKDTNHREGTEQPQDGGDPNVAPDRDKQIKALDTTIGPIRNGLTNPATTFGDAVDTAHKLINAQPGDQQKIFSEAAAKFVKDNPNAPASTFSSILESAVQQSPEKNGLLVNWSNEIAILRDKKAVTEQNPSGIVASEFVGGTNKESNEREKAALQTEKNVAQIIGNAKAGLTPEQAAAFDQTLRSELQQSSDLGLLTPRKDIGARVPDANTPSLDQQVAAFQAQHKGIPDQLAGDVVKFANQLAFSKPSDIQSNFAQAIDALRTSNPTLSPRQLTAMISDAAAINKLGGPEGQISWNDQGENVVYSDARFGSDGNAIGRVAIAPTDKLDAVDKKAFQATADVAATIREGARPFSTPQLQQKFNESVIALYDLLRTE